MGILVKNITWAGPLPVSSPPILSHYPQGYRIGAGPSEEMTCRSHTPIPAGGSGSAQVQKLNLREDGPGWSLI